MSQTNIAITQLAQVGLGERIALEIQGHPEALRQAAFGVAPEELKKMRDAVPKTDDSQSSRGVRGKKEGKGGQGQAPGEKRQAKDGGEEGEPPPDAASDTPWAGNIVNLKV